MGKGKTGCAENTTMALGSADIEALEGSFQRSPSQPLVEGTPFTRPEMDAYCATVLDANQMQAGETLLLDIQQSAVQDPMTVQLASMAAERGIKVVEARLDQPGRQRALAEGIDDNALFLQLASPFSASDQTLSENESSGASSGYDQRFAANSLRWCIGMWPTPQWAETVYPELSPDQAYLQLGQDLLHATHSLEPGGFVAHQQRMSSIRDSINSDPPQEIRMTSASPSGQGCGTDLRMRMADGQQFMLSGWEIEDKWMQANIPSEEVWGTPDPESVEGVFECSKPWMVGPEAVHNIEGRFEKGRLVEISCNDPSLTPEKLTMYNQYLQQQMIDLPRQARAMTAEQLASPEGAQYAPYLGRDCLGELGLVSHSSSVGQTGRVFQQNIVDENSGCHLGIGASYGAINIACEEGQEHGGNVSGFHDDFTIGTSSMQVTAISHDGSERPLIDQGEWYDQN